MDKNAHIYFLKQALSLAKKGLGSTFPNPMVGAIIVKNGKVIGRGYHKKAGLAHAEIEAISLAKSDLARLEGTTLYVNLEPCANFGKTPPCVETIIKSGIRKVVFSTLDPNAINHGQGKLVLEKAGIEVSVGLLENEALKLNEAFFTFHQKKRPFIAIKFAASLDGKIATYTGDSKWITNEKARAAARNIRSEYQAVVVGINTVIKDNPHLGIRQNGKQDPLRIILGYKEKLPANSQVLRDKNVLIVNPKNIKALLSLLTEKEIISILVEGGGETIGRFVDEKLVDKVYAFHAPLIIGGEKAISAVRGIGAKTLKDGLKLTNVTFRKFDDNILTTGYLL
ncbi:bifunctional diaminohydroxyphosphoribosylaminopyrimidine deaminase/5-amino-6-(5-phosphoribosylamino)uracil reductase RibD [Candidatus Microgenomates bacterium]|nr:bifunctional diaminohydroxyphosphoribosylaminopyrimidine deaminase/5-amino-6-(5-phosphoribosylamino)uracil reductase RibD [Candidatus Microgenomates bacterium]